MHRDDVKPGMTVYARGAETTSDAKGVMVGTVVRLSDPTTERGDYLYVTDGTEQSGNHRWIPFDWVSGVDDLSVYLDRPADQLELNPQTPGPRP